MLTILKCVFIFHTACINTHVKSPSNISLLSREQCLQRAWPTHLSIRYCKMLILHWRVHALWEKLGYRGRLCHNFNVQYCQKIKSLLQSHFRTKWKMCVVWESGIWIHFQTTQQFIHLFPPCSNSVSSCAFMQNSEGHLCHAEITGKFGALQMFAELTQKYTELANTCLQCKVWKTSSVLRMCKKEVRRGI